MEFVFVGQADRFTMTACEGIGLVVPAIAIDGTYGVDDVFSGEASTGGDDGLACRKAADFGDDLFALGEDGWAAGAMNGAVDTSAAEERRVGGVDDGVGDFAGDVGGAVQRDGSVVGEEQAHGEEMSVSKWVGKGKGVHETQNAQVIRWESSQQ